MSIASLNRYIFNAFVVLRGVGKRNEEKGLRNLIETRKYIRYL